MSEPTKLFAAALIAAQQAAQAVAKGAKNGFHGYRYASAEAIIAEGRSALSSAGLGVIPLSWEVSPDKTTIEVRYRVYHVSGEHLDGHFQTSVIPDKGRPQDKAEATALTYNLGYYLRALLLLPRVEADAEVDSRDDRNPQDATALIAGFRAELADAKTVAAFMRVAAGLAAAKKNGSLTGAQFDVLKGEYDALKLERLDSPRTVNTTAGKPVAA